jgi:tetratricopeptide (TPR) repeat protein
MARSQDFRVCRKQQLVLAAIGVVLAGSMLAGCSRRTAPTVDTWGTTDYGQYAQAREASIQKVLSKAPDQRERDAGIKLLDYAAARLAAGDPEAAQRTFYEGILLVNDLSLGASSGDASLIFAESLKVWQGEAYERAMVELLHGIALMQLGDFENARVAFDRTLVTDRFSDGAVVGLEGHLAASSQGNFVPNDVCHQRGGALYQRDFLAAYVLRTLAYIQQGRIARARQSWAETRQVIEEIEAACAWSGSPELTWTGHDGKYTYPRIFVPPFRSAINDGLMDLSFEDLERANLLVIAATGSRPDKVRTGSNFVHDGYLPPAEAIYRLDVLLDGEHVGGMMQGVDLFGQVAGRGRSAKDRAQDTKAAIEALGMALESYGVYGVQYIGSLIRIINQEEADVRQWNLLPNAVHVWVGRVEPGPQRLSLVASGHNAASEHITINNARRNVYSHLVRALEQQYLAQRVSSADDAYLATAVAPRHTYVQDVAIEPDQLHVMFVAERVDRDVRRVPGLKPQAYVLGPRRDPPPTQ